MEQCPYNYIYGPLLLGESYVYIIICHFFESLVSHYFPTVSVLCRILNLRDRVLTVHREFYYYSSGEVAQMAVGASEL